MRKLFELRFYRQFVYALCAAVTNAAVPMQAWSALNIFQYRMPEILKQLPKTTKMKSSRPMTMAEMKKEDGRVGLSPYLAGQSKWDISYKGIDMFTGNYSTSVTDLDFQGGYGIPVSVQRTYSANQADEGPFGPGWQLSADVRTTAGGLLKGSKAPVMATPTSFVEKPLTQSDPNLQTQPAAGVTATDAGGNAETIQKDVDGVLTTPPWDNNVTNPTFSFTSFGGAWYQVQTGNTTTTADGTVYVYTNAGKYTNGMLAADGSGTAAPSNILAPLTVTDRQGNVTTYTYSSDTVNFQKANGQVAENKLTQIQMPNGHIITFNWGLNGQPANRISSVCDNGTGTSQRWVYYTYDSNGCLQTVKSAGGKITTYGYSAITNSNNWLYSYGVATPTNLLLTTITDPRGLTTTINYIYSLAFLEPYGKCVQGAEVYSIVAPNGNYTQMDYNWWDNDVVDGDYTDTSVYEYIGAPGSGNQYIYMKIVIGAGPNSSGYATSEDVYAAQNPTQVYQQNTYEMTHNANYFVESPSYSIYKQYDPFQQSLLYQTTWTERASQGHWDGDQMTSFNDWGSQTQTYTYNFQGNPLTEVDTEYQTASDYSTTPVETSEYPEWTQAKQYAYWGPTKYYQQKAVVDRESALNTRGRISYTDYYDSSSAAGSKGMTSYTYSDPYAVWNSSTLPGTDSSWQSDLLPATANTSYNSETLYDSVGRATDVYKLETVTGSTYNYVHTATAYATDGSTSPYAPQNYVNPYNEPTCVTEDVGGINRKTYTIMYDSSGHATMTMDGAGHVFQTVYANNDYQVDHIEEVDGTPNVNLVQYTYGSTGVTNGQVTNVTDWLSGVQDVIGYDVNSADSGYGMPASTTEVWPWDTSGSQHGYNVAYTYTPAGDRGTTTYTTDNGTTTWQYDNYACFGLNKGAPSRAPQTMRLIQSGVPAPEEFHYLYDGGGALMTSTFAMTPKTGFTPTSGNPWYDPSDLASSRARVVYDNFSGENFNLYYYWDNWSSSGSDYTSQDISGFQYAYNPLTMLKSGAMFLDGSGTSWLTDHNEAYTYDSNLDYLTQADYNVGGTGDSPETWQYDAAGNRTKDSIAPTITWTYDNLNRMTSSPGLTYSNDILGNRLSNSVTSNGWDQLNRMTSFTSGGGSPVTTNYVYRPDGLRTNKYVGTLSSPTSSTTYACDGEMGFEDVDTGPSPAITDYALGARNVDRLVKTASNTTTIVYPIYDGHGNMASTLSENGSGFSVGNQRSYDAWGNILSSNGTGDPKGRYCANLGHKQDDESGLVYMRARYYDPVAGRFQSQDPNMSGHNWYAYCSNQPVSQSDLTGEDQTALFNWYMGTGMCCYALALLLLLNPVGKLSSKEIIAAAALLICAADSFAGALGASGKAPDWTQLLVAGNPLGECAIALAIGLAAGIKAETLATMAVVAFGLESTILLGALLSIDN